MLLEHKVAVITGSAVGIGRGIAVALAGEVANIIALDIDVLENQTTAAEVQAAGQECLPLACDVADKGQVRNAINQGLAAFGRVDRQCQRDGQQSQDQEQRPLPGRRRELPSCSQANRGIHVAPHFLLSVELR